MEQADLLGAPGDRGRIELKRASICGLARARARARGNGSKCALAATAPYPWASLDAIAHPAGSAESRDVGWKVPIGSSDNRRRCLCLLPATWLQKKRASICGLARARARARGNGSKCALAATAPYPWASLDAIAHPAGSAKSRDVGWKVPIGSSDNRRRCLCLLPATWLLNLHALTPVASRAHARGRDPQILALRDALDTTGAAASEQACGDVYRKGHDDRVEQETNQSMHGCQPGVRCIPNILCPARYR